MTPPIGKPPIVKPPPTPEPIYYSINALRAHAQQSQHGLWRYHLPTL